MPYQGRLPYSYKSPFNYALDQGTQTVPSLAFIGDTNNGIFSPATDNLAITTDGVERLRVTSVGNVGIGITNPVQKLEIDGNQVVFGKIISGNSLTHPNIGNALNLNLTLGEAAFRPINLIDTSGVIKIARVHNNFGAGMDLIQWDENIENILSRALITAEGGNLKVSNVLDGSVIFQTNNIERMRLDSSGRLGLGTSSPLYTFDCRGQGAFELYNGSGGGNVLNFRPSLGDANKYNMSISSYDHSGNGIGPADGLSINGFDGVSICTNNSTERTERLRVTQAGLVGIGTTSPIVPLEVSAASTVQFRLVRPTGVDLRLNSYFGNSDLASLSVVTNHPLAFHTNNAERARIDSSGRLLIGTSTSVTSSVSQQSLLQVYSTSSSSSSVQIGNYTNGTNPAGLHFDKSRGSLGTNTVLQSGDNIGSIKFNGADGTNLVRAASIDAQVDGTPGANDMPGRLVFSTTPSGSSSPTERVRLTNSGALLVGTTATPVGAGSGAVVAQNRVVISSTGAGGNQVYAGEIGSITATTGTVVFKFKTTQTGTPRPCFVRLAISNRNGNNTPSNQPAAEYAFQLHQTSGTVCTLNGATSIFEFTYVRATHFAFADLGGGECTVTLTNPVALVSTGAYRVELVSPAGFWTLDSVTTT
jgi:hypothetical protein